MAGGAVLGLGAIAAAAGLRPWFAPLVLVAWGVTSVVAFVVVGRGGHGGGCRLGRSAWIGLAALGLPLRLAVGLAI